MEADEEALMEVCKLGIECVYVCLFATHGDHANNARCMPQRMAYFAPSPCSPLHSYAGLSKDHGERLLQIQTNPLLLHPDGARPDVVPRQ